MQLSAHFTTFAETVADGIIIIDTGSTVLFANGAVERILGWKPGDLVGQSLTFLMPEPFRPRHLAGVKSFLETGQKHIPWDGYEVARRLRQDPGFDLLLLKPVDPDLLDAELGKAGLA